MSIKALEQHIVFMGCLITGNNSHCLYCKHNRTLSFGCFNTSNVSFLNCVSALNTHTQFIVCERTIFLFGAFIRSFVCSFAQWFTHFNSIYFIVLLSHCSIHNLRMFVMYALLPFVVFSVFLLILFRYRYRERAR